jgi:tetratricopeptide (TPR) repeat protein
LPSFEFLLFLFTGFGVGAISLILWIALRNSGQSSAQQAVGEGRFEEAADLAQNDDENSLLAAAVGAKHLLRWADAEEKLKLVLAGDADHGEALLELALVNLYRGDLDQVEALLRRAESRRADLLESIQLHRALLALLEGDDARARARFEEVEAPLETKLRIDVGEGEPAFAEWFLHAALLWRCAGRDKKASWAWQAALRSAPGSRLPDRLASELGLWPDAPTHATVETGS